MARYIDADRFEVVISQRHSEDFIDGMDYILDMIDKAPTEDVVPRSEVEKFIQEIDEIQKDKAEVTYLKEQLIKKAKQEVSKQIFEELESGITEINGLFSFPVITHEFIAELKKKYIGE